MTSFIVGGIKYTWLIPQPSFRSRPAKSWQRDVFLNFVQSSLPRQLSMTKRPRESDGEGENMTAEAGPSTTVPTSSSTNGDTTLLRVPQVSNPPSQSLRESMLIAETVVSPKSTCQRIQRPCSRLVRLPLL